MTNNLKDNFSTDMRKLSEDAIEILQNEESHDAEPNFCGVFCNPVKLCK